jgi:hypothetical protein
MSQNQRRRNGGDRFNGRWDTGQFRRALCLYCGRETDPLHVAPTHIDACFAGVPAGTCGEHRRSRGLARYDIGEVTDCLLG